jgi:hypothetical protein
MMLDRGLLPHLDRERILPHYQASPGNEVTSGKFENSHSSAALAANFFGFFVDRPADFPGLPDSPIKEPITSLLPEQCLRFPWARGRHPWLDAVIIADNTIMAVESKRYEPFRPKRPGHFADAYFNHDWGAGLAHFAALRDIIANGSILFRHLDAVQLIKHAFGVATQARKSGRNPILYYLYAEPNHWLDGGRTPVLESARSMHRSEIAKFANLVAGDEVRFVSGNYVDALSIVAQSPQSDIRSHADAVAVAFAPL